MRLPVSLGLAALLLVGTRPLTAQDRRVADRLDPITAGEVQRLVDSARAIGLPTEPLVQKALEGSTLGASGDRIRAAVGALYAQLSRARAALGSQASDAEVTAAAAAIRAGVPADTLQRLRSLRSGRSLVVPISVLADLVAEGTPPDRAYRSVFDLARDGRSDDEFLALRRRSQVRPPGTGPDAGEPSAPRPAPDPPNKP
jgi:hypothetical protein